MLSVLELVAEHQPAGVGELSRISGLPKSTVQRTLRALADAGWIRPVGREFTRWALTPRMVTIGRRAAREGACAKRRSAPCGSCAISRTRPSPSRYPTGSTG
ncbi:helix-turn-helix domain-containing protein [Kitasatospora paranensis]|uniref:helix-turn-helix domain-containing protein n=1 Tax=Kitasatospora paranensis TaxID=258053 RepID=UPI003CD069D4